MPGRTTIMVSNELRDRLAALKEHPRESYEQVIARALDSAEGKRVSARADASLARRAR